MTAFRSIPSIEQLLRRPALERAAGQYGREAVTHAARSAAAELRDRFAAGGAAASDEDAAIWIESRALMLAGAHAAPSLRRVINATGVIVHTNLGRAPLAEPAAAQTARLAAGYSNLEYDLEAGTRGHRHVHAERLLRLLTGAEAALVVNNAAAAALLALTALARGREVIVSRGELVEIGGGFRVPEILAESGAILREVGTTNRTRVADYAAAVGGRTALILRVHPSNFRIQGFAERPELGDLVAAARKLSVPLIEDLGSGWLGGSHPPPALGAEPSVRDSVAAGVDLVVFSGDKILGGPQAGIAVGRGDLVRRLQAHPLMRAVRADKLTYAALEGTLALWANPQHHEQIPVVRMVSAPASAIRARAAAIAAALSGRPALALSIVDGVSTIGGGSAAGSELPTSLLAVTVRGVSATDLAQRLRQVDPPVIGRVADDRVVLDLRTVAEADDAAVTEALSRFA